MWQNKGRLLGKAAWAKKSSKKKNNAKRELKRSTRRKNTEGRSFISMNSYFVKLCISLFFSLFLPMHAYSSVDDVRESFEDENKNKIRRIINVWNEMDIPHFMKFPSFAVDLMCHYEFQFSNMKHIYLCIIWGELRDVKYIKFQ